MPNHKNMFGTFYGNSSRSGNSTSSRGMGARRSRNGGVSIGNGNLVRRRSGRGGMMNGGMGSGLTRDLDITARKGRFQKICNCLPRPGYEELGVTQIICSSFRNCAKCCESRFGSMYTGEDAIQGVRRRR